MFYVEKISALVFAFSFLFFSRFIAKKVKSDFHPAAVLSLVWFLYYILPIFIIPGAPINSLSTLFIFACVFSFGLPALFINWTVVNANFVKNGISRNEFILISEGIKFKRILILSSSIAIYSQINFVINNGFDFSSIISSPMSTAGAFVAMRGNKGVEYGLVGMISTTATYFSASIGGLIYRNHINFKNKIFLLFLSLLPSAIGVIVLSSKLMLLISLVFFISALIINNIYYLKMRIKWLKIMKLSIWMLITILPLLLISIASREGFDTWDMIRFGMFSYIFGQVFAFSDFFACYINLSCTINYDFSNSWHGKYTLTSVVQLLGYEFDLPPGTYEESIGYNNVFSTNVFTFFRGLILDFGIFGSLLFMFIFGCIANFFYYKMIKFPNSYIFPVINIHIIVFSIMTYLISVFMARYMYANIILLFGIYLYSSHSRKKYFRIF